MIENLVHNGDLSKVSEGLDPTILAPSPCSEREVEEIVRGAARADRPGPCVLSFYDGYADPREIALWDAFVAERRACR